MSLFHAEYMLSDDTQTSTVKTDSKQLINTLFYWKLTNGYQ